MAVNTGQNQRRDRTDNEKHGNVTWGYVQVHLQSRISSSAFRLTSLWNMNKRCSSKAPQPLRPRRRTFTLRRFHPRGWKMKVQAGDGTFV